MMADARMENIIDAKKKNIYISQKFDCKTAWPENTGLIRKRQTRANKTVNVSYLFPSLIVRAIKKEAVWPSSFRSS